MAATAAGETLLSHARTMLNSASQALSDLKEMHVEPVGSVVVGLPHRVAASLAVPLIREFRRRLPHALLSVVEGLSLSLREGMIAGRIDLGLMFDPAPTPLLSCEPLMRESMLLVAPKGYRLPPHSVAVIGACADLKKNTGRPVAYLQKHGFAGRILPVNPRVERIGDLACYPHVASLPEVPDVAVVLLGAERAHQAVRELSALGCAAAIVLASGYTETGEDGAHRQRQLIEAAGSMRLLGPNTIGLVNLTDRIVLSPSGALEMDKFPVGGIGVVSQSGGILGSLLSRAAARGIGLSKLISTSNEVDLELADFIDHLADDPATKVIALYVETSRQAHPAGTGPARWLPR
ncbi:LysR substrate-binding domain-containing protein [Delftia tsuruhatensis]